MFDNIRTTRRLKADAAKVSVPGTDLNSENAVKQHRNLRTTVRFTACTAVAAAVVLTGTLWLPKAQKADNAHSFEIIAYAANGKSKAVTLKQNVAVTLGNMYTRVDKFGANVGQMTSFACKGKNLSSVTYTAQNKSMNYRNKNNPAYNVKCTLDGLHGTTMKAAAASLKKATVCSFEIPKSMLSGAREYNDMHSVSNCEGNFRKLWNAGKFKQYSKGYWRNFPSDDYSPYSAQITYDWNPTNPDEKVAKDVYVVTVADRRNKNYVYIGYPQDIQAQSITVDSSDKIGFIYWDNSSAHTDTIDTSCMTKAYLNAKSGKGSPIIDTITASVKFKDGKTVTKHIQILFNSKLKCCMKLTD